MHPRPTNHQQRLKCKRKIKINSLEAAICNVALFKSMKDKQFRDSIFISYCEDGVILQAVNQAEWKRANDHIMNFINNKKIALLTFGYDKQQYQNLISKGLKQITRRIKQRDEECPYINIIHYQKIRKSCQYMDKQKYVEPLKDWEIKNKRNPNFAFLIVQPACKFDEVKRGLLQFLTGQNVPLNYVHVDPIYFIYLLFYSKIKQKIKDAFNKKLLQINGIQPQQGKPLSTKIKITSFVSLDFYQYSYTIIPTNKNVITKSGLQYISQQELKNQCKNSKSYCKSQIIQLIQNYILEQQKSHKQTFVMIPYKKEEQEKYQSIINKYINNMLTKEEIMKKLQANVVCSVNDIEVISLISHNAYKKTIKACINQCPFLVIEYSAQDTDLQSFIVYLDQLKLYYCTYLIRFYGISLKYKPQVPQTPTHNKKTQKLLKISSKNTNLELSKIYVIFDYHNQTLQDMFNNDMILDDIQVSNIALQLLYCINYLHSHQQPRCLGPLSLTQIYWPMGIILPYLGSSLYLSDRDKQGYSIQNDIKKVGELMRRLLGDEQIQDNSNSQIEKDENLEQVIENMTKTIKQERWSLKKCISQLQQIMFV